jgi:hypothetical protein
MRILLLLRDTTVNGITTYNRTLARELARQGHEVHTWPARRQEGFENPVRLPPAHPVLEPLVRPWLTRRLKPDLLFVNHYSQARFASKLRKAAGIPWVACMHNGHSPKRMAQWRELFGNASGVVTMCETLANTYSQLIEAGGPAHKPPVMGSNLPVVMPPLRDRTGRTDPITLGYCSRLSGSKGPRCQAWLEAIALLPEPARFRVLVIGGGSHLAACQAKAAQLGLNAEFTGTVADPGPWLDQIDVITGAGYALLEGMVRGAAGVGLGFGGCIGAINLQTLREAYALNFGDHCPRDFPSDPTSIADALSEALARLHLPDRLDVNEHIRRTSHPQQVVAGLVDFLSHRLVHPQES